MLQFLRPHKQQDPLFLIEQLYREYKAPLWRYAYKILHDEHLADDVVQSVFTKAIEKIDLISSLDCNKTKAYFVIMVRNLSYTIFRQQKSRPQTVLHELEDFLPDLQDTPEEYLLRQCEYDELKQHLSELHDSYRDVLTMKFLYNMSDEEIAGVMGIKAASVRVVIHRALKALKKQYAGKEGEPSNEI